MLGLRFEFQNYKKQIIWNSIQISCNDVYVILDLHWYVCDDVAKFLSVLSFKLRNNENNKQKSCKELKDHCRVLKFGQLPRYMDLD